MNGKCKSGLGERDKDVFSFSREVANHNINKTVKSFSYNFLVAL